jgi:hypothetical protein
MGTMETCFHGNKKTSGGIFYDDGRIIQDPNLTPPWKNHRLLDCGDDVAPEIGLGDMDESEPEATIDEIEDMDMMNALAATINGHKKPGQHQCLLQCLLYRFQKNKTCAAMLCPTSSTKSNKNKSWSMRHRYSLGANKKKRRGGLASKFYRQQRGATLQVQAKLHRLDRLLR